MGPLWTGQPEALVFTNYQDPTLLTTSRLEFRWQTGDGMKLDNVWAANDDLVSTYTYAYNDANELQSKATKHDGSNQGTTTFAYDDWGRMTQRALGSRDAAYTYAYGSMLTGVVTDLFDETGVSYDFRGDGLRHSRTVGTDTTVFNWGAGGILPYSEENTSGTLLRTHFGYADGYVEGSNPATGDAYYYAHDHLGSVRGLYDASKTNVGALECTPFGDALYTSLAVPAYSRYAGYYHEPATSTYLTAFRTYQPDLARWMTRDPLGMVDGPNVYAYVWGNPVLYVDSYGQFVLVIPVLGAIGGAAGGAIVGALGAAIRGGDIGDIGRAAFGGALGGALAGGLGAAGIALGGIGGGILGGGLGGGIAGAFGGGVSGALGGAFGGALGGGIGGALGGAGGALGRPGVGFGIGFNQGIYCEAFNDDDFR